MPDSFEWLTDALTSKLLGYYRKRLPDPQEAEDYVQRTFLRALNMPAIENAEAVLYQIATNLLTDEYRSRQKQRGMEQVSFESLIGHDGTGLDHLPQFQTHDFEDSEFADGHDAAVRALESSTRDAYILSELRGLPSREAAAFLGVSHTTVAIRRESATATLREEITA